VLVSEYGQHASLKFVVGLLKQLSLELNFLVGFSFVVGAGCVN
jgi:hypothetical protein